jgi:hypothetical protein
VTFFMVSLALENSEASCILPCTDIIPATQEVEIGRPQFATSLGKNLRDLISTNSWV